MEGPEVKRMDTDKLSIRKWSNLELDLSTLGHTKLAQIEDMKRMILPEMPFYWEDFKPFIWELKLAFFPTGAVKPNCITLEKMVEILEKALKTVQECPLSGPSVDPTVLTEMHEYDVLKYGKDYLRGQAEAPRKRIKTTKPSPQVTQPPSTHTRYTTRSSHAGGPNVSKPSKLHDTCALQGQNFGATI